MAERTFGPVEFVVVALPGAGVPDALVAETRRLVESDVVDLLDVAYISVDTEGELTTRELEDLTEEFPRLAELGLDAPGLAGAEDLEEVAEAIAPGTAAIVLVVEHTWSRRFVTAVEESGAYVMSSERISAEVVNEIVALDAASD
ncbi:DUF6325 family protein [Paraoerskovia marina]|uniref:DUF1269 domain-containing protein n=1 Tax=Paraoerskovia marina TaxID=545619 RepID=A0A1H1NAK9_9CELL|nr:DUF6325 family protein [Paraoerskovia marina]SDR96014.1 hypothetical protein SAMN04489860_0481 [Paraoerskovia marina]